MKGASFEGETTMFKKAISLALVFALISAFIPMPATAQDAPLVTQAIGDVRGFLQVLEVTFPGGRISTLETSIETVVGAPGKINQTFSTTDAVLSILTTGDESGAIFFSITDDVNILKVDVYQPGKNQEKGEGEVKKDASAIQAKIRLTFNSFVTELNMVSLPQKANEKSQGAGSVLEPEEKKEQFKAAVLESQFGQTDLAELLRFMLAAPATPSTTVIAMFLITTLDMPVIPEYALFCYKSPCPVEGPTAELKKECKFGCDWLAGTACGATVALICGAIFIGMPIAGGICGVSLGAGCTATVNECNENCEKGMGWNRSSL